ncbi:hypothetical protein FRB91_003325 [Serendipita sp. 411]|nr:hypothetical protein FRB91_003325 [Serendipita sp. 411]
MSQTTTDNHSTQQELPIASVHAAQEDPQPLSSSNPESQPSDHNQVIWNPPGPTSSPIAVDEAGDSTGNEVTNNESSSDLSSGHIDSILSSQTALSNNNGSPTTSERVQTIPEHRTGLVRPTAPSTWERPPDPKAVIQPGIITACIFGLVALMALSLCITRRWRRKRTRQRTRSVINLLNRVHEKRRDAGSPDEQSQGAAPLDMGDTEIGITQSNTSNGAYFVDHSIVGMKTPVAARVHMERLADAYIPTRPSPLRIS